jgi:hypothetical protein
MKDLREYALEVIKNYPELKEDVIGLYILCQSEIEEGGSPDHEIQLCLEDIRQLIEE